MEIGMDMDLNLDDNLGKDMEVCAASNAETGTVQVSFVLFYFD
jgi:hypothetical protein